MKKIWTHIRTIGIGLLTGLIALLLLLLSGAVRLRSRTNENLSGSEPLLQGKTKDERFTEKAENERCASENTMRARSARSVAEHYEGVGRAIDDGRSRFASRAKNRVLAAGGRRNSEQHPE